MAAVGIVMSATAFYEFAACHPIQYAQINRSHSLDCFANEDVRFWWDHDIEGGYCLNPTTLTGFSFSLSAVSILTDWYCAVMYGALRMSLRGLR